MYIKSIVLDGFKSYGNRVEITGFDPEFNAITGLNGTGKSNILDAICFVLGITNLSNVRAGSLQELIYKHGQAGITKATVSITFDNTNRAQQPIGYDSQEITVTRQVVMGGKNKYMINGNNVQNKRVTDLFCSVQLNVNNPHFLIMQGRITKVLNMKPPEILSMVEEAAGTRMYEAKKQAAQKTIEKKDAKLRELNDIIKEDLSPRLQKLQEEREQFQEYQKVVRELDNLTKLHVAWTYVQAQEKTKEADEKVEEVRNTVGTSKDTIAQNKREIDTITEKVDELNKILDQESGERLRALEGALRERERDEAAAAAAHRAAGAALRDHDARAARADAARAADRAALADRTRQADETAQQFAELRARHERAQTALQEATRRFLAVSSGLHSDADDLQDRLVAAKRESSEASTRISQAAMESKAAVARLRTLEAQFRSGAADFARDQDIIAQHQDKILAIERELAALPACAARQERLEALEARARTAQTSARRLRERRDALAARLRCGFKYQPPERDFDPARVKGTMCRLFDVCDPKYCTALETVAGGKLYNVVVDTEATSKLLLQRGQLASRVTIVPLNKIRGTVIDDHTLRLAQSVGGGADKVRLALDLVTYAAELRPAMAWAFGSTLVCSDLDTARRVTFHPRVSRRAVTLDGDVFDPSGTLSGGAVSKSRPMLQQLQDLVEVERELRAVEAELAAATAELQESRDTFEKYQKLKQTEEMMRHELEAVRARLGATSHAALHAEIHALREQIQTLSASIEKDRVIQSENNALAKELQAKVEDIEGHREREHERCARELAASKAEAAEAGAQWGRHEGELDTLRAEAAALRLAVQDADTLAGQLADTRRALLDTLRDAGREHDALQEQVKEIQESIRRQKAEISGRSGEIKRLLAQKEQLSKSNREAELKIKELDFKIKELQTEAEDCKKQMRNMEREHAWISAEREYFGGAGGVYDFTARAAASAAARRAQLLVRRDRLARGVNARAHTLLSKEEEAFQEVVRKKQIVEADRAKLVQVMEQLDERKRRTLAAACEQVTRDFASIFSALLPGAHARLQPPPGQTVLDGLEVQVGFNGTWKESLGELSGGQRSLVALSLVLALLLFKPAPLYILDEVDAALDLSHTQNIGLMLREHFRHSQFIIVSLKDGMFNNANVLFRTRFADGMSSVQRTLNARR